MTEPGRRKINYFSNLQLNCIVPYRLGTKTSVKLKLRDESLVVCVYWLAENEISLTDCISIPQVDYYRQAHLRACYFSLRSDYHRIKHNVSEVCEECIFSLMCGVHRKSSSYYLIRKHIEK